MGDAGTAWGAGGRAVVPSARHVLRPPQYQKAVIIDLICDAKLPGPKVVVNNPEVEVRTVEQQVRVPLVPKAPKPS